MYAPFCTHTERKKSMQKMKRLIALLLVVLLMPVWAMAEAKEEAPVTHTAKATVALKVRRAPDDGAGGADSIPRDSIVYIIEYGNVWCKVRTSRTEGYIKTQYLADLKELDEQSSAPASVPAEGAQQELPPQMDTNFTMTKNTFREQYYAHTVKGRVLMFEAPSEISDVVRSIDIYQQVVVGEISGDWSYVRYKGTSYGYIRTNNLFKWDRIDPYAGPIPGLEVWTNMVFVNHTTTIFDMETNKALFTVNPGAAFCAGDKDEYGRYPVPYDRTIGYVMESDIASVMPVTDWQQAQSGDLISVMTTFFALGKSTLQIQGRNWNIHLASDYITGTVLQPNEHYNMNQTIGPYRQSSGYMSAPILSDDALTGYGGGTCQVNTTFYNAVIQLPLLVTHRKVHADVGMDYVKQGFDAAVGGGDINLTMINTLPYAVRFMFMNSDGVLTCCIFKE